MDNLTVNNNPLLIVLSGPSGVGKDAVLNKMKCVCQNFHFTVTATTRPKRKGEVEGKDYIFLSRDDFEEKLKAGEFFQRHHNLLPTLATHTSLILEANLLVMN
mgnify:CR=1 FL=1